MSNLQLRLISALVMIPFVFGAIILGGWPFTIFILIAFILCVYEWTKLSLKTQHRAAFLLAGAIYLPVCFYEFYILRTGFENGLYLVLTMLLVVWAADTGAYFVGRKFGKHKMAPTISPNKSWEGLGGSIVFSGLILCLLVFFASDLNILIPNVISKPSALEVLFFFVMGGMLGYVGQIGDLIESFLKRKSGAKDSSNLIPGHGGVLDRVDSILLVAPFFVLLASHVL